MNKNVKNELTEYFEPPKSNRKKDFLNSLDVYVIYNSAMRDQITYTGFIFLQITYIRKWVWAASVLFFTFAMFSATYFDADMIRVISSFMPVLALAIVTESGRSENYGMAELEISTRFSLRYVILARLLILGVTNLITFCLSLLLISKNSHGNWFLTAIYISCPYLLTSFLGLFLTRKIRGKESAYMCAGIAALVSVGNITAYQVLPHVFETAYFTWWLIMFMLLIAGCANELYKKIQMSEELLWSLY